MNHLAKLPFIASLDLEELKRKEATYKGSWKKRGGVGAFMMLARKWDRLENMCEAEGWDIFKAARDTKAVDGTALAEIQDLRRYLLLVEAEIMNRVQEQIDQGVFKHDDGTPKEDSNKHAAGSVDTNLGLEKTAGTSNSRLPKVHSDRS